MSIQIKCIFLSLILSKAMNQVMIKLRKNNVDGNFVFAISSVDNVKR